MSQKLNVLIVTDHSLSMSSYRSSAMKDYNRIIDTLRSSSGLDVYVTHVACGVRNVFGWGGTGNGVRYSNHHISNVGEMKTYEISGNSTPLFDAVDIGIDSIHNRDGVFIALIVTDGEDNDSRNTNATKLASKIKQLQSTDLWTFTFSVPRGSKNALVRMGLPADNIQEWDLSSAGLETASALRGSSLNAYVGFVASGQSTSTDRFYANLDNVSQAQVKAALTDISQEVLLLPVSGAEGQEIRAFVQKRIGKPMKKGAAFYQLTKTESKVQDYKVIMIRDKTTNAIYSGAAARQLLQVPTVGMIKLSPGRHGNYDIFIQSTSVNRKLDANTQLIYWENVGVDYKNTTQTPDPVSTTLTALTQNTPVTVQQPTSNNRSNDALANYLSAIVATIPADPVKKVTAKKAAAKKAVAQKTTTKRVRNRNTIQEKVRRFVNSVAPKAKTIKTLTNSVTMHDLGFDAISAAHLAAMLETKFNTPVRISDIVKARTLGDVVKAFV